MLIHQTLEKLQALRLRGMADALDLQRTNAAMQSLSFEERIGMLVDAEWHARERRQLSALLKKANFKLQACAEDIDYRAPRGLDRQLITSLLACDWIAKHLNVFITGPTGLGKTWLGCMFGQQATRMKLSVVYWRFTRLIREIEIGHGDGSIVQLRSQLAKVNLLILDDWGLAALTPLARHELMELIDDRAGRGSLLITSQLPVDKWHDYIGEPTLADAILDRIVHNSHHIELSGPTMRRSKGGES